MTKTITSRKGTDQSITAQGLTVVVPTYNGSTWLPKTISKIEIALKEAKITKCEIVVVNDGSTDDTIAVVSKLKNKVGYPLRTITQENGGRFIARQTGTNEAKYPNLLFVDTRVYIGKNSLSYLIKQNSLDESREVWCSHVRVDSKGNIYARFWETVAFVAWRKYFINPKDTSYGISQFDDYPKGTTCFYIKRSILRDANDWFVKNTKDLKTSNDDTLLLRYIAKSHSINISPSFWCLYHARSSLKQYTKHVFHRGKVFVDGFLRNDGNRFFIPLIFFLILSIAVPLALVLQNSLILPVAAGLIIGWVLSLIVLIALRVPTLDALSTFILMPLFAVYYGSGIWNAFLRIYVFRTTGNKS